MKLKELFRDMNCQIHGDGATEIKDLKYDSRSVR